MSLRTRRGLPSSAFDERVAQVRHGVGDGPHDGVADQVGEADLAHAAARAVAVDHLAVDLEQLGRHLSEARRRRHGEAARHVRGDGRGDAADRCARRVGRRRRLGSGPGLAAAGFGAGVGAAGSAPVRRCVAPAQARPRQLRDRPRPGGPAARGPGPSIGSRRRTPATPRRPSSDRRGTARTSPRPTRSWSRRQSRSTRSQSRRPGYPSVPGRSGALSPFGRRAWSSRAHRRGASARGPGAARPTSRPATRTAPSRRSSRR